MGLVGPKPNVQCHPREQGEGNSANGRGRQRETGLRNELLLSLISKKKRKKRIPETDRSLT